MSTIYSSERMSIEEAARIYPYKYGWMHNGYYRVFIAATQPTHYMIAENEKVVQADKEDFLIRWYIGVSAIFICIIVPLAIKEMKYERRNSESLYKRLLRLCNPKKFIKEYGKDKIERANTLYGLLLSTSADDKETLMKIQSTAMFELDISMIDKEELDELRRKVNPQNFMKPYNAENVTIANELYSILSKEQLDYMEIMELKEKVKSLY